jgi:hypothetical protein
MKRINKLLYFVVQVPVGDLACFVQDGYALKPVAGENGVAKVH